MAPVHRLFLLGCCNRCGIVISKRTFWPSRRWHAPALIRPRWCGTFSGLRRRGPGPSRRYQIPPNASLPSQRQLKSCLRSITPFPGLRSSPPFKTRCVVLRKRGSTLSRHLHLCGSNSKGANDRCRQASFSNIAAMNGGSAACGSFFPTLTVASEQNMEWRSRRRGRCCPSRE